MFNHQIEVRNKLSPLINDFKKRMIIQGERPFGGTMLFGAMKHASTLLLDEKKQ